MDADRYQYPARATGSRGSADTGRRLEQDRRRDPAVRRRQRRDARRRQGRRRQRGARLCWRQGRPGHRRDAGEATAARDADDACKLMATFNEAKDSSGKDVIPRLFIKGAAPAVGHVTTACRTARAPPGTTAEAACRGEHDADGEAGLRVMAGALLSAVSRPAFDAERRLARLRQGASADEPRGDGRPARRSRRPPWPMPKALSVPDGDGRRPRRDRARPSPRSSASPVRRFSGAEFAALPQQERLDRIDSIGVASAAWRGARQGVLATR